MKVRLNTNSQQPVFNARFSKDPITQRILCGFRTEDITVAKNLLKQHKSDDVIFFTQEVEETSKGPYYHLFTGNESSGDLIKINQFNNLENGSLIKILNKLKFTNNKPLI